MVLHSPCACSRPPNMSPLPCHMTLPYSMVTILTPFASLSLQNYSHIFSLLVRWGHARGEDVHRKVMLGRHKHPAAASTCRACLFAAVSPAANPPLMPTIPGPPIHPSRLRQAVNHPYLVVHNSTDAAGVVAGGFGAGADGVAAAVVEEATHDHASAQGLCSICHDPLEVVGMRRR